MGKRIKTLEVAQYLDLTNHVFEILRIVLSKGKGRKISSNKNSCVEVFCKKSVLKDFTKFIESWSLQNSWGLFFNKVGGFLSKLPENRKPRGYRDSNSGVFL